MATPDEDEVRREAFRALQDRLGKEYARRPNEEAIRGALKVENVTHTSIRISWPAWQTVSGTSSTLYDVHLEIDGKRTGMVIGPEETGARLTGLEPQRSLALQLVFRGTAGRWTTDVINVTTPGLDDFSSVRMFADHLSEHHRRLIDDLGGGGRGQLELTGDTTIIVSARSGEALREEGDLLLMAKQGNIPIVSTAWLEASHKTRLFQPVAQYYPH